ncbi:LppP/LprE family lipoprotein [Nocardia pseudobrasiliensis]|uniref:LppP/LprE lipoprotein n=1 Tax=Nocardia pseudobrasiliensis TaxID=45979 RepID=A0A370I835_9NOCA|nr:LppP/LprE family lipoprotein [Nocardia pseudobrasiliensis]RDI66882.1 LppP/LprE lipoprotein [Nocardia pseudobrasiliensis]
MRNVSTALAVLAAGAIIGATVNAAPAQADPPRGSGHGYCFDLNSELAHEAMGTLAPPSVDGDWQPVAAGDDPISEGCQDVLSWMTVEWQGIHPGRHILFFSNGSYLGTATSKPYAYTDVLGKTKSTVSVQYRWPKDSDPLCCPSGSSVVTFTLADGKVRADGEFPPN